MSNVRNTEGLLTPESLRLGLKEEWAMRLSRHTALVTLRWAGLGTSLPWRVTWEIVSRETGERIETHVVNFEMLNDARARWHREVQQIKDTARSHR